MMTERILIIEDDHDMARLLQLDLQRHGFESITARDGLLGLRLFHEARPDLVLLDVSLPGMDGETVCQRIRSLSDVPILMITAQLLTEEQVAHSLDIGADELMLKPLRRIEFIARLKALLRRARLSHRQTQNNHTVTLCYEDSYLLVDLENRRVQVRGEDIRLTPTEFKLLEIFVRSSGQVLTFERLLEEVWGPEYHQERHYPRIYVSHLRHKIEPDISTPTYIQNEYGVGYRFTGQTNH
jgi:DNA-binding response OmpR family regulator